jgi:hypothetical protein
MEVRSLRRTVLVARFQMLTIRRSRNFVGDDCLWGTKGELGVLDQQWTYECFGVGSYRDLSSSEAAYVTTASGPAMVFLGV